MKYSDKDIKKFSICNKLISRGVIGSSSYKYSKKGIGDIKVIKVNCGKYKRKDIVGVSVNGQRSNRVTFDKKELKKALKKKVTIVTDNFRNRERAFNTGERELVTFLLARNYKIVTNTDVAGIWKFNKH